MKLDRQKFYVIYEGFVHFIGAKGVDLWVTSSLLIKYRFTLATMRTNLWGLWVKCNGVVIRFTPLPLWLSGCCLSVCCWCEGSLVCFNG
jgi:hypothetical protein